MIQLLTNVSGLREAFKVLKPAISTKETRYYLNGVFFEKKGNDVYLIATDGHKLISINVNDNGYFDVKDSIFDEDFGFIIPRCAIEEFIAPDKIKCEFVNIRINENKVIFEFDSSEVIKSYKLVDGIYPEWQKIMPEKTKPYIKLNPKYVEQFCKVLKGNDSITFEASVVESVNKDGEVIATSKDANQPQLIRTEKGASLIIMPMRM